MNSEIKNTVKNLFSTLKFEDALEATRDLRKEYIAEHGVKSWNSMVAYYKKANIQPVETIAAEQEPCYPDIVGMTLTPDNVGDLHNILEGIFGEGDNETPQDVEVTAETDMHQESEAIGDSSNDTTEDFSNLSKKELKKKLKKEFEQKINDIYESLKDEDGNFEKIMEANIALQDEYLAKYGVVLGDKNWKKGLEYYRNPSCDDKSNADSDNNGADESPNLEPNHEGVAEEIEKPIEEVSTSNEERIEYMIYRNNLADKLDWFGHRENFFKYKLGDTARIIRMNSCGVSEGTVVAIASLTLDQIDLFHKCYKEIARRHKTYAEKFIMTVECLNKIGEAIPSPTEAPKKASQLTDYVLNFKK